MLGVDNKHRRKTNEQYVVCRNHFPGDELHITFYMYIISSTCIFKLVQQVLLRCRLLDLGATWEGLTAGLFCTYCTHVHGPVTTTWEGLTAGLFCPYITHVHGTVTTTWEGLTAGLFCTYRTYVHGTVTTTWERP